MAYYKKPPKEKAVISPSKLLIILSILFVWLTTPAIAASPPTTNINKASLIYTVQKDDTLILIALRYNLKMSDIVLANNLPNPNIIFPGQQLALPGIPPPEPLLPIDQTHTVQTGETLFSIAQIYGSSVSTILLVNNLPNPNMLKIGQILKIPKWPITPEPLKAPFVAIELSEPHIIQGRTLVIKVTLSEPAALSGIFEDRPIFFTRSGNRQMWGIVAIHALAEPGIYPIALKATKTDGSEVNSFVNVTINEGSYGLENIQLDSSRGALLNGNLIRVEREKLADLWSKVSPRPQWEGRFWYPVEVDSLRITSYFGTRRRYNNSPNLSFHSGTDFGGGVGTVIYAPAAGTVVLAEKLTVRGNAVIIDHGMGLFSGYWHQDRSVVTLGQKLQAGDLIGYIGNTGLVTGPHLHWEIRLNGIAVEPVQWIQQVIP